MSAGIARRGALGLLLAAPAAPLLGENFAGTYKPRADPIGEGIWLVRGADEAITFANGGAIANAVIMAASRASGGGAILFDCGPSLSYARALSALAQRLTGGPVRRVFISHLHPDHALGAAAFAPDMVAALPQTRQELERDGNGFADAMFRILADWMRGTSVVLPGVAVVPGAFEVVGRRFVAHALAGHSAGDLVLLDEVSGTLLTGDLVFHDRAPATPDADLAQWRHSLDALAAMPRRQLVPGHGPLDTDGAAISQTRDWLNWLEATLNDAVARGRDMSEAGDLPIPPRFAAMKLARYELQRSIAHFYARIEQARLPRIDRAEP